MSVCPIARLNVERWAGESASPTARLKAERYPNANFTTYSVIPVAASLVPYYYNPMSQVIREYEPLALHTVFKIGGPARFFVGAGDQGEITGAVREAVNRGLPWMFLGAGSNVLVSDEGFRGTVIHPVGGRVAVDGDRIAADAGVTMARLVAESLKVNLRGFEWAIGVPGTIGGSVRGNAGCFGGEMKDVVEAVTVFDAARDTVEEWPVEDTRFGYRTSVFKERPELVVMAARLRLKPGTRSDGERMVREFTAKRTAIQDIGASCAGCVFQNIPWDRSNVEEDEIRQRFPGLPPSGTVPGISAGFLIDRAGLKGYRIGGARISERHGNFFVNTGGARAGDVRALIERAKREVREKFGLELKEEIQYVGFA